MATTQQDKPGSKSRKSRRKAEQRGQQPDQAANLGEQNLGEQSLQEQDLKLDRNSEHGTVTATGAAAISKAEAAEPLSEPSAQTDVPLVAPADVPSMNPGTPAACAPIGMQTIANAYRSYAHKSLQQTGALAEKLMGARSFDKAVEAQAEFARQAYTNLVEDSQNIWQLHSRMAKQTFNSWQRLAIGARSK